MERTKPATIAAAVLGLILAGSVQAGILTVGTGGTYATIQDAIDNANPNDTIDILSDITEQGITVDKDLTIRGQGADVTTVQAHAVRGSATDRIFYVNDGAFNVIFQDMTLKHGNRPYVGSDSSGGGAIATMTYRDFNLLVERCAFVDNDAAKSGGAISYTSHTTRPEVGMLTILDSTFTGNRVSTAADPQGVGGGAVYANSFEQATIRNSTFTDNTLYLSGGYLGGGAVYFALLTDGQGLIENSTFVGNEIAGSIGTAGGAAVRGHNGWTDVDSCLFADNAAATYGVVYLGWSTPGTASHSVGECVPHPSRIVDDGTNIWGVADAMIGPLADNGGTTLTHALLAGSPAIDAGSNPAGLSNDQRGTGYPRTRGLGADAGAYESVPEPATMGLLGLGLVGVAALRRRRK